MIINEAVYKQLLSVCDSTDAFSYSDHERDGIRYRIFGNRLASYSDWQQHPLSFELRGLMVRLTPEGEFSGVVSRPMTKFFNLNENPYTQNIDLSKKMIAYDKADGSLVSTYWHNDQVCLKSKGSVKSEQAVAAEKLLYSPEYKDLLSVLRNTYGITVDMEYCAPDNRIVLPYVQPKLYVLGTRFIINGDDADSVMKKSLEKWWAPSREVDEEFVKSIKDMKKIEGFVIHHESGIRFKVKTDEYLSLHSAKDGISSPKKVASVILNDAIDDIRSMFHDDPILIPLLDRMQTIVQKVHNSLVAEVEKFYNENKELDRKSYAILAQKMLPNHMGLVMNLFLGKKNNYAEYLMKHYDEFFPDMEWYSPNGTTH